MTSFFELPMAELSAWKEQAITKEFYRYLDIAEASCADQILANVRLGKSKEAEILSGKLEAFQELKSAMERAGVVPLLPEAEDEFHDPAELHE